MAGHICLLGDTYCLMSGEIGEAKKKVYVI